MNKRSPIDDVRDKVDALEVTSIEHDERITKPDQLRSMNQQFIIDDGPTSANRAAVQELVDFEPPYDQAELEQRGMGERFNVNFGMAASLKNEAVGAYLDLFTSPNSLTRIRLDPEVDEDMRETWAAIMDEEFTKMFRSWDGSMANMLLLADIFVTHGVAIPWFDDQSSMLFEVGSLEDCKFPKNAVSTPSKNEIMTINRTMSVSDLFAKIEDHEDEEDIDGWNGPAVKYAIENCNTKGANQTDPHNYEKLARDIKACRISAAHSSSSIELIWGIIKELDGKISVYATTKDLLKSNNVRNDAPTGTDEKFLYKKRNAYSDANRAFLIFPFSVGNKNTIYTIRGLGYAIYESGQADNILRCKLMDAARHRGSEVYQPDSAAGIESIDEIQFIDVGHAMIAPKGLRVLQGNNSMRLDQSLGFALDSNSRVLDRHSAGLARNSISENPTARRNEMQVAVEVENLNKMQGFALSLFYGPYDKLMRELVRRSFTETQSDLVAQELVRNMKEACKRRGVPADVFNKIDLQATQATRLLGAGSKSSRIIGFQQMSQLFSSMDDQGQEYFNFDFASEIQGSDKAARYFGLPGQRRPHVDVAIARLENTQLLEGDMMDPIEGENRMVHLREHLAELVLGVEGVNEGSIDIADWTMRHIPLYRHSVDTLEMTSVHESRIPELNSYRQQIQQVGELIDNGLRHLNKLRQQEEEAAAAAGVQVDEQGNPIPVDPAQQEQTAAQMDNEAKMNRVFAEGQAKIQALQMASKAKIDIQRQESLAKISALDAETAARIRRQEALDRASR